MSCKQTIALIDAMPFANPSQRQAVLHHSRDCTSCRLVLATAETLDSELTRLPQSEPPVWLAATIIARTAHHQQQPATANPESLAQKKTSSRRHPWSMLLTGITLGLAALGYQYFTGELTLDLTRPLLSGGTKGLAQMPAPTPAVLVLAMGLLLYTAGLFAPARGGPNQPH